LKAIAISEFLRIPGANSGDSILNSYLGDALYMFIFT